MYNARRNPLKEARHQGAVRFKVKTVCCSIMQCNPEAAEELHTWPVILDPALILLKPEKDHVHKAAPNTDASGEGRVSARQWAEEKLRSS